MNYGIVLPNWVVEGDPGLLVEYGELAEEAGWDGVFLADHLIPPTEEETEAFPDPWITLTGIAARTNTIKLGSWITPIPRRQPWQLARDLATLDRFSEGRVILGTGLGTASDYSRFGRPWKPKKLGQRYDEALDVITGLWSGEPFSYDGEFYTLDDAVLKPTPIQQPRIPIIIGGVWPNKKPFHRGARWDGIVPHYRGDGIIPEDGGPYAPARDEEVSHEEEVTNMLEYYRDTADAPGEVFLPADPPDGCDDWIETCEVLGATWVYTRPKEAGEWFLSRELIREGPPG